MISLAALGVSQRPANTSICDYYTTALLKENNATNQETLLTLVVNTAVIGNYTKPNVGIKVPGILASATFNGTQVNLLPYFNGMLASTNTGGSSGASVNFLDGGGSTPLMMDKPANDTTSNQYTLLTHLYEYFAVLLGCSEYGSKIVPYAGDTSMYEVHKYMALGEAEVGYFIDQVGLAAASFGVAESDVQEVGQALNSAFGYRCSPPTSIPPTATAELQAICIESDCPISPNSTCAAYASVVQPMSANSTSSANSTASSSMAPSSTSTMVPYKGRGTTISATVPTIIFVLFGFAVWLC